ncbi:lantibiotic dehydratase [Sutcliffiella horikoshii]|uniref:thiopeptide-type bacteriocin biosynthesis protein n=1 Tax=Sutcliffiella horikoshii TaxID=79883 RepID=UPI00384F21EF
MAVMDNYLVRRPALNVNVLDTIFNSDEELETVLAAYLRQDQIKERILIASSSLYQQLEEGKLTASARLSLVKYLLRMSSRTMPFGLFSGISSSEFSTVEVNQHSTEEKKVRLSIKWYKKLVAVIEEIQGIESQMKVYINPLVIQSSQQYQLDIILQNKCQQLKIKKGPLIQALLNHSFSPIKIVDLLNRIVPENTEKKLLCLKTIKSLLNNQFLVSELQPSVCNDKDDDLLDKLLASSGLLSNELYSSLYTISTMIETFTDQKVGEGIPTYLEIINTMKRLVESDKYLVIDLIYQKQTDERTEFDRKEIETMVKNLSPLSNLSQQFTANAWKHYYLHFVDKYGFFNEVALMELLDNDKGLGLPSFHNLNQNADQDEEFLTYMLDKLWRNHCSSQHTLELKEDDMKALSDIYKNTKQHKLKDGYDMKFSVFVEKGKKLFHLGVNSFGNTASSFSGRLDLEQHLKAGTYYADDDYISCELNGVPINYPDLGITSKNPDYVIDITCKSVKMDNVIQLGDIYVGADASGLYLKSRKQNKRLLPVSTHMLYYNNFVEQKPLLFLSLFGKYISEVPANINLGRLKTLSYLPRIQYKNIIISPRRWTIPVSELKDDPRLRLKQLAEEHSLNDQYIYLLDGDKTLPIMLHTAIGQELVLDAVKRTSKYSNYLTFIEAPELNDTLADKRNYVKDYIVTVPPSPKTSGRKTPAEDVGTYEKLIEHEWEYYKIFYHQNQKQAVLNSCLDSLYQSKFSEVFYINYMDVPGQPHLRMRYKKGGDLEGNNSLVKTLENLRRNELVKDYSIHLFEPEHSRYGGRTTSKEAYRYFCQETMVGFQLNQDKKWNMIKETEQGIISMLFTLFDFHDNYESAVAYLEQLHMHVQENINKDYLKKFKSNRNFYTALGNQALELYKEHQDGLFKGKKEAGRRYAGMINQQFSADRRDYIFNSIIHMTLNRVIGINKQLENEINCMVKYIFHNLKYRLQIKGEYNELL